MSNIKHHIRVLRALPVLVMAPILCLFFSGAIAATKSLVEKQPVYGLNFNALPARWDEGIPLGNGWLGALIWQNEDKLRLSVDRVDLWDDRPMPEIDQLKFNWVKQQVAKKDYGPVQKIGDDPYSKYPAPSKIPGAAIEFDLKRLGKVTAANLDIRKGLSTVTFDSGVYFTSFVDATAQAGFFTVTGLKTAELLPELLAPAYDKSLGALGYRQGSITRLPGRILYHQPTYGNNYYEVLVEWKRTGNRMEGAWTITNGQPAKSIPINNNKQAHINWWKNYWNKSAISLPDTLLQHQYDMDMYKFGCVAREDTSPISLQAIWTADDGDLPPWKGDLHHDLNTQMSYWPGYAANHLDLTASFTNWLWKVKEENRNWTKSYFEVEGINVPGVTTISGKPMGGWIQYSMSPTASAWLAQHFYQQWRYSMDDKFLKERCYPYLSEVARYLDALMVKDPETGKYQLPLSSAPEFHENSLAAWFTKNTNHDLALIHNLYLRYGEVAEALNKPAAVLQELADKERQVAPLDVNETGLTVAPGANLSFSHRHLSQLMAIYPLGLFNKDNTGEREVMERSLKTLEKYGSSAWYGFSFVWMATIYAQAGQGDSAAVTLRKFARNFCGPNSFHLNGDQKGGQYSDFVNRPFTLEANFGFAEAVHQLLLQSEHGYITVFPSVPADWKDVGFKTLRAQGAFLISATRINGLTEQVSIVAEKGGLCRIKAPFKTFVESGISRDQIKFAENGILEFETKPGQMITLKNGYE